TLGVQDSGSKKNGNGIYIHLNGGKAGSITVDNNTIQEVPNASLLAVEYQAYAAASTMKIKIINNQLKKPTAGTANGFCGPAAQVCPSSTLMMFVDKNGGPGATICTTISGNSVFDPTSGPNSAGLAAFQLGVRSAGNTLNIEGTQANARQQIITTNTITNPGPSPTTSDVFVDSGTPAIVAAGTCGAFPSSPSLETTSADPQMTAESRAGSSDASEDVLRVPSIEKPDQRLIQGLTQQELNWMVQAALARWQQAGVSGEDLARLYQVSFEIAQLGNGQLANRSGSSIRVDEMAAGFGWYSDPTPTDDNEFQVIVPGKELQATDFSPAHDKIDLLTVIMRELGQVYMQGKDRLPKTERRNLRSLMETTLTPGVRRLPLDQWRMTPLAPIGSIPPATSDSLMTQSAAALLMNLMQRHQTPGVIPVVNDAVQRPASPAKLPAGVSYAVYHRPTTQTQTVDTADLIPAVTHPRDVAVMGIHEDSFETEEMPTLRPAAMTVQKQKAKGQKTFTPASVLSGGVVSVGPFNLPAGESVTI